MTGRTITTYSPEETAALGEKIAGKLSPGDLVALVGELGAGKTVFVKGLAKGLQCEQRYVNSPSFVILKQYAGKVPLYHFDVYRLECEDFEETIDHRMYFYGRGVSVIEWADKIRGVLPGEYLEIQILYGVGDERKFRFHPRGKRFEKIVDRLCPSPDNENDVKL